MKNKSYTILTILIFIFLAGCGNDQYAIEKRYWQAKKQAEKIFKNPHASPPKELERTVGTLDKFAQEFAKNKLSVDAEFTIARLYVVKEEYGKARTQLEILLNKYSKSEGICSEAMFLIGNSYEIENKWDLALKQYKEIMQRYPITLRGFEIPIYIAQHYKIKYQPDKMLVAYQEAIAHYNALAEKNPDSLIAYNARGLVVQCYIAMKDWQNAISALNTLLENYKGKVNLDGTLMEMALIYDRELKDKVKAKETLQTLLKDYPRSRLINRATALLKEWDKK